MKKLIALTCTLLIASCGFHFKGHYAYDKLPVTNWYVEGSGLQKSLEKEIAYASGKVVPKNQSQAQLKVIDIDTKKDIYTITRAAKLNEYLLSMRVTAQAYKDNQAWGNPIRIEIRRTMPYSDSMILGKEEEESTIWREIQQDAANQIVRQLGFIK